MRKLNILFIIVCLVSFCSFVFSQDKPLAVKIGEYNQKTEAAEKLVEKTNFFLKKLSGLPKDTKGFIAIPSEDFLLFKNLSEQVNAVLSKYTELKYRVELLQPAPVGYRPKGLPEKTEFWLISLNAEKPYSIEIVCGLTYSCPDIEIIGTNYIYDKNKTQLFSASVSGAGFPNEIKYNWTVSAGEIIKGEGTPLIEVDFSKVDVDEITITFELEGFSDCQTKIEHKIKIVKNPK